MLRRETWEVVCRGQVSLQHQGQTAVNSVGFHLECSHYGVPSIRVLVSDD
jgi:hypothetical protein